MHSNTDFYVPHNQCYNEVPVYTIYIIYWLAFPADIGRKPASTARGSRQCLHAAESRLRLWRVHAG